MEKIVGTKHKMILKIEMFWPEWGAVLGRWAGDVSGGVYEFDKFVEVCGMEGGGPAQGARSKGVEISGWFGPIGPPPVEARIYLGLLSIVLVIGSFGKRLRKIPPAVIKQSPIQIV